ncbi:hypothetical protein BV898_06277 [Hypsibius exemplaris]|uniref:Apple domain-containing protein n=1 Tax=Hypsibius exemplaris TaxID=2072580 RepID=A0A1W0WX09_HYPEX|nr:hypothetical protein BV898_06277 [Hypsibius exemplaris]
MGSHFSLVAPLLMNATMPMPLMGSAAAGEAISHDVVITWSKRCSTIMDCDPGFSCKMLKETPGPGGKLTIVNTCVECSATCRADTDCQKFTNTSTVLAAGMKLDGLLHCRRGCCQVPDVSAAEPPKGNGQGVSGMTSTTRRVLPPTVRPSA